MASLQPVSFTSPGYDYGAELSEIQRRQALSEALRQQSMEPIQQQTGGRYAVPISPWQGLAKIGQGAASGIQAARAQQEQRSLAEKAQTDYRRMLAEGLQQLQGTPVSEDAAGNVTPAQAPNPAAAMGTFGSHPMGAQFIPAAMQQMQRDQLAQSLTEAPQPTKPPPAYGQPGFDPNARPVPTGPKTGGPAGGQPMKAWLQIDPTGKSYMEQLAKDYMEAQKPVINRGFGVGTMQGGKYAPDQASIDQALNMERGRLNISEPYRITNVEQAGGGHVPTFNYQLPGYPGERPKGAPIPQAQVPQPLPRPAPSPGPQPSPAAPQGDPWASMPRLEQPRGMGQSTYNHGRQAEAAKYGAQMAEKMGPIAESANQRHSFNDQALSLIDQATTGSGAMSITNIQNFLTSRLGIPEEMLAKVSAGDPTATLELNKNLINAATQTAKANYGSRMTQSEVMMQIKQASPNVDMTKAAIRYLLLADNARAQYQMKQSQDLGRYLQQGGDPYQFEGWYAKAFPMSAVTTNAGRNQVKDIVNSPGGRPGVPQGVRVTRIN